MGRPVAGRHRRASCTGWLVSPRLVITSTCETMETTIATNDVQIQLNSDDDGDEGDADDDDDDDY